MENLAVRLEHENQKTNLKPSFADGVLMVPRYEPHVAKTPGCGTLRGLDVCGWRTRRGVEVFGNQRVRTRKVGISGYAIELLICWRFVAYAVGVCYGS